MLAESGKNKNNRTLWFINNTYINRLALVVNALVLLIWCYDVNEPRWAFTIHYLDELNGSDEGNQQALCITDDKRLDERLCHESEKRTAH